MDDGCESFDEQCTTDQVQADKVISEVNPFLVLDSHLQPLHNPANVVAKLQLTLPLNLEEQGQSTAPTTQNIPTSSPTSATSQSLKVDADGDIEVPRLSGENTETRNISNPCDRFILIEHTNSTTLDLVGNQIWRGAFILSDFILQYAEEYFRCKNILELGSGTGFSSIVASLVASKVIVTDLDDPEILDLIKANLKHNHGILRSDVITRPLDFLSSWTPEVENLVAESDVIIAADVVYHNRITDGFVLTLQKCLCTGRPKIIFVALEKRFVFTLSDLDVVAPAYDHFLEQMENMLGLHLVQGMSSQRSTLNLPEGRQLFVESVDTTEFPIHFNYEPSKDLVLWKLQTRIPSQTAKIN